MAHERSDSQAGRPEINQGRFWSSFIFAVPFGAGLIQGKRGCGGFAVVGIRSGKDHAAITEEDIPERLSANQGDRLIQIDAAEEMGWIFFRRGDG